MLSLQPGVDRQSPPGRWKSEPGDSSTYLLGMREMVLMLMVRGIVFAPSRNSPRLLQLVVVVFYALLHNQVMEQLGESVGWHFVSMPTSQC
jgi:hypothetical protein